MQTCGAASNTRNCLLRFSSSSRIAATLPHLQHIQREKHITIEQIRGQILHANLPVTVVWSRPDSDYLVPEHPLIPLHHQLMSTAYVINIV